MKKTIIKRIKEKIELNEIDYADSYIAEQHQLSQETPDETELSKARLMMKNSEDRIAWLKKLLKKESSA